MSMKGWVSAALEVLGEHSVEIAAGTAIFGVVVTAILASKATPEAEDTLDKANEELKKAAYEPEEKEKEIKKACAVKLVKLYLPAFISGVLTIVCIVVSVKEGHKHQAAAIASACSASQTALLEYKDKAKEILGEKEVNKVEDAIAEEKIKNVDESRAIRTGWGDDLIYESQTGQLLYSDMDRVRKLWNTFERSIDSETGCSVADWIDTIQGENSDMAFQHKWKRQKVDETFDLIERAEMTRNGKVCYYLTYWPAPKFYEN